MLERLKSTKKSENQCGEVRGMRERCERKKIANTEYSSGGNGNNDLIYLLPQREHITVLAHPQLGGSH